MNTKLICSEEYGPKTLERQYRADGLINESKVHTSLLQCFRSVFLPQGYPESVSRDYLVYQFWDTVQAFSSSITGSLATHALLKGVGVGDENASVMAATLTWIMQRGSGMIGQIVFAWAQGSFFDSDCKRWRLFADILNDFSLFLDIVAPYFLGMFRIIVCVSGVCKSLVGVAGGATRAALTQHQAIRNNISDVSAKDGSQETVVNLVALIVSLIILPIVTSSQLLVWLLYFIFTSIHIFANYQAVRSVVMSTFNPSRFYFVTKQYLQNKDRKLMSKEEANLLEPVVFPLKRKYQIEIGCSLENVLNIFNFPQLYTIYKDHKYILYLEPATGTISIILHKTATVYDQLMATFQAEVIEFTANNLDYDKNLDIKKVVYAHKRNNLSDVLQFSLQVTTQLFPDYYSQIGRDGWETAFVLLNVDEWRMDWGDVSVGKDKLL